MIKKDQRRKKKSTLLQLRSNNEYRIEMEEQAKETSTLSAFIYLDRATLIIMQSDRS